MVKDFDVDVNEELGKKVNNFNSSFTENESNLKVNKSNSVDVNVIEAFNNEIITKKIEAKLAIKNDLILADLDEDILKIAVVERYGNNNIVNGFIRGFNLKKGAIASSVAHDSHNIIVLGTNSEDMVKAVNLISKNKGGLVIVDGNFDKILKLPIAGLMSDEDLTVVSQELEKINKIAIDFGCTMDSPFMTLSFMALLVIPSLRLSDKGLFDVDDFKFINLLKDNS